MAPLCILKPWGRSLREGCKKPENRLRYCWGPAGRHIYEDVKALVAGAGIGSLAAGIVLREAAVRHPRWPYQSDPRRVMLRVLDATLAAPKVEA